MSIKLLSDDATINVDATISIIPIMPILHLSERDLGNIRNYHSLLPWNPCHDVLEKSCVSE